MNKNSRQARKQLSKAKRAIVLQRLRTTPGSSLITQNYTLNYGTQKSKSKEGKGKVCQGKTN